ncbi:MAG: polysaccharide deacetylase family protein [Candidatus Sulfotelmatobacter sp.]
MTAPNVVFLMYHELELPGRPLAQSEAGYVRYVLPQAAFRAQMDWLRQNEWVGLSVSEALHYPSGKVVAITFDDGCETDLIAVAPILSEAGFHATFYVTAGFLDRPGHMSAAQLRALSVSGFEIGCHSMTHAYLNDLGPRELQVEIVAARSRLEDLIGRRVEHFSCPGGRYDERALAMTKQAGYRSVANSHPHANSASTDPFHLGRVVIMRETDNSAFSRVCCGNGLWKAQVGESVRGVARKILGNPLYDRVRRRLLREP